jgi:1L-myo-inositol 1-phosphate cytidylyltransferase
VNAIVLAAGNGDRFQNRTRDSKLLHPFLGRPVLLRTRDSAREAGIDATTIVLGYQADRVRALVERGAPRGVKISFALNPDWRLENGVSVLAARDTVDTDRFALLMGDHVFEPPVLRRLVQFSMASDESVVAVDSRPVAPEVAAEATTVRCLGPASPRLARTSSITMLSTPACSSAPAYFSTHSKSRARSEIRR